MQSDDAAGSTDAVADDTAGAGSRFRLPPRTLLLVAAGVLLLIVIAAGSWAYLANSQRQAKIEATRAAAVRDKAAQARQQEEWAAQVRAAENIVHLEAARKAHEAVMAGETPAVVDTVAAVAALGPAGLSAAAASAVAPDRPGKAVAAATSGTAAPAKATEAAAAASAAPASAAVVPAAGAPAQAPALGPDGCTLSGSSPQEFGTALGRCLEEFNRMEEGVGEAAAPARRSRR